MPGAIQVWVLDWELAETADTLLAALEVRGGAASVVTRYGLDLPAGRLTAARRVGSRSAPRPALPISQTDAAAIHGSRKVAAKRISYLLMAVILGALVLIGMLNG